MTATNPSRYLVVIGDVIGSRQIQDRSRLQERLNRVLGRLNQHGGGRLNQHGGGRLNQRGGGPLSPYTLTLGDEFQAVYRKPGRLFQHAFAILEEVHPHRVRFSFGLGQIATEINREQSLGMDGEAFYRAREGMDWLKDQRADYRFVLRGLPDPRQAELINNTLFLISNQLNSWKLNRITVLRSRLENQPIKEIAEKLGISETAVYRNIYDGSLREIIRLFDLIAGELENNLGEP